MVDEEGDDDEVTWIWTVLGVYIRIIFVSHIKPIMCLRLAEQKKWNRVAMDLSGWHGRVLLLGRFDASAVQRHPLLSVGVDITISYCYVPTVNC